MKKIFNFSYFFFLAPILFTPIEYELITGAHYSPILGDIIITEIMLQPSAAPDQFGEYFELYNTTDSPIDMFGMVIFGSGSNVIEIFTPFVIGPQEYAVFGPEDDTFLNGGVPVDYEYPYSGFQMDDSAGGIFLFNASFGLIDDVIYDGSTSFPIGSGASMSLDLDSINAIANNSGDNWCRSYRRTPGGDSGTPGGANDRCIDSFMTINGAPGIAPCDCCCCDEVPVIGKQDGDYGG